MEANCAGQPTPHGILSEKDVDMVHESDFEAD